MKKATVILAILCAAALLLAGCIPQEAPKEHTHTLTHTEGYPATCLENGITENWFCLDCGKRFADAEATKEITFADIEIIAAGHTPAEDDGDCTTAVACQNCSEVATPAKEKHNWENGVCTVCGITHTIYLDVSVMTGYTWTSGINVYFYDSTGANCGWAGGTLANGVYTITKVPDEAVQVQFIDLMAGESTATMPLPEKFNMFTLTGNTDAEGNFVGTWTTQTP